MTESGLLWTDSTTYSRDCTGQVATSFSAKCGQVRLTVTCGHVYYPGQWIGHALPLFKERVLSAKTREEAQEELVILVRHWLTEAMTAIEKKGV